MQLKSKLSKSLVCAVAVTLVVVTTSAFGATINLTCTDDAMPSHSSQVSLDSIAKTATTDNDPMSSAYFSDSKVMWSLDKTRNDGWSQPTEIQLHYELNRNTGVLIQLSSVRQHAMQNSPWSAHTTSYHCAIARKLF